MKDKKEGRNQQVVRKHTALHTILHAHGYFASSMYAYRHVCIHAHMHTWARPYIHTYVCLHVKVLVCVNIVLCVCVLSSRFVCLHSEIHCCLSIPAMFPDLRGSVWVSAVTRCWGSYGSCPGFQHARNPTPGRSRNHGAMLCSLATRFEGSSTMADVAYAPLQESIPFEKRAAEAGFVGLFQDTGVGTLRMTSEGVVPSWSWFQCPMPYNFYSPPKLCFLRFRQAKILSRCRVLRCSMRFGDLGFFGGWGDQVQRLGADVVRGPDLEIPIPRRPGARCESHLPTSLSSFLDSRSRHLLEQREASRILAKYPDRVPVICATWLLAFHGFKPPRSPLPCEKSCQPFQKVCWVSRDP